MMLPTTITPSRTRDNFAALGIEIPGLDELAAISKCMYEATERDPGEDLAAEITTGKVTADNAAKKLLDAAASQTARLAANEIYQRAQVAISKATAQAVRDHAPHIIETLAPRFAEAADRLAATAGVNVPAKAKRILNTPGMADTHRTRQEATADLSAIALVRTSLATSYRFGPREPAASWWIADSADLDQDRLDQATRLGRHWYALTQAGYQLRLSTPEEAAALEAAAAERTQRAKREKETKRNEQAARIARAELEQRKRQLEEANR